MSKFVFRTFFELINMIFDYFLNEEIIGAREPKSLFDNLTIFLIKENLTLFVLLSEDDNTVCKTY
jgi:hypothetical protein